MGEMIEYQERFVYEEEYKGHKIFLLLNNFRQYLIVALSTEEIELAKKIDGEMRYKRTCDMDWYEMCSLKFFVERDTKLIPNSLPVYSKPELEVIMMGYHRNEKEVYALLASNCKYDIDARLDRESDKT